MSTSQVLRVILLLGTLAAYPTWGQSPATGKEGAATHRRGLADFDARDSVPPDGQPDLGRERAKAVIEARHGAIAAFLASPAAAGSLMRLAAGRYGVPKTFFREGRPLSAPSSAPPEDIARDFLRARRTLFPFTAREVDALRLVVEDASGGAVFLAFNQTLNGIDVFNGQIKFTLSAAGEVIHAGSDEVVPELSLDTTPRLSALAAVTAAFDKAGMVAPALSAVAAAEGKTGFRNPRGGRFSPITAELAIFPMTATSARLAYRIFLEADAESWYEILIDAESGDLLFRHNLYVHAQGHVWLQSPMDPGGRQFVTFPSGWMPAGGSVTTGNNVDAYLDANGDDKPDSTNTDLLSNGRAFSATQVFDFPSGDGVTSQNPRTFQAAAVTNLFYLINTAHDYYYSLGFNEAAGNFQTDKFGKGVGHDAVLAEAQQPSLTDNASFAPTPEGTAPKIRMGLFTRGTANLNDDLDSSYDGQVVVHEYGHGVSNRLVGAKVSTSCLNRVQSGAMGEGWSDYFAISFYNNPVNGAYLNQDTVKGGQRHSYEGYPYTYEDIGNAGYEVHNDGEIWAATLWDLRKALGQGVTDLLVMNGLKSTPCHPSMTDARDAILAADLATNAGVNRVKIWQVFAQHGLGFSAFGADGYDQPGFYVNAAYDQLIDIQPGGNPAITSVPPVMTGQMGNQYSYAVTATNPASGTLAYAVTSGPPGMTIDGAGVLRWTTSFTQQRVKIAVADGKGGKVVQVFTVAPYTTLTDGVPLVIDGAQGATGSAYLTVPAGAQILQVTLRGGSGDAVLFLYDPDALRYASTWTGTIQTLSIATPKSGLWKIGGYGYSAFSGVSLTAAMVTPSLLAPNAPLSNLSGVFGSESFYRVTVPTGAFSLKVSTSGGTGDVDLFVKHGSPAVCTRSIAVNEPCVRDFSSATDFNAESVSISSPAAGDWYIDLFSFAAYAGVTLTANLTAPPTLSAAASSLTFGAVEAGTAPAAQTLAFSDLSGSTFTWTAAAVTATGGAWLAVSKASGTGAASLQITVDQKGLKQGTYQGTVTITASTLAGSPLNIPVTLTVTAQPALALAATSLTFQTASGLNPAAQNLPISNTGGGTLSWTAAAATTTGGSWLKVTPASGTGNATIQVSVAAATLAAGSYSGTIAITAAGAANSPAVVQVSLTVALPGPAISGGGIAGAGGSIPSITTISPGGLASIFGSAFAPAGTAHAVQEDDLVSGYLPAKLAGTCVEVDGKAGFLTFVSPGQINFQVPTVSLDTLVNVVVVANCGASNETRSSAATVRAAAASPEFLYWVKNADGRNPVVAVNAVTGAYVGAPDLIPGLTFAPAKPGDILTIYGVSFGATTPAFAPGEAPGSIASTANVAAVSIGTVTLSPADLLYAGVSPGIAGLYQLNIRVPNNLPDGDQPLTLTLGSFQTPSLGFVTVRAN